MVWNTPYSVRLLKHIAHPSSTSTCVWNDGWVKAGSRHCRTGSREGMLVNMDGDLLVLCSRLRRLKPRTAAAQDWRTPGGTILRHYCRGVVGFVGVGRKVIQRLVNPLGIV